jgi:hypothetical protein
MSMLNRWYKLKRRLVDKPEEERPKGGQNVLSVTSLNECEKWR